MTPTDRAKRFVATIEATGGGTVIMCHCGSAKVDHLSRYRIRCADCDHEADIDGFQLIRARWLEGDLVAAVRRAA